MSPAGDRHKAKVFSLVLLQKCGSFFRQEDYRYTYRSCIAYAVLPILGLTLHIMPSVELSVVYLCHGFPQPLYG